MEFLQPSIKEPYMKVKVKKSILNKTEFSLASSPSTTTNAGVSTRSPPNAALLSKVCDTPVSVGAAITPITTTTLPLGIAKSPPITGTSNVATSHPTPTPTLSPNAWLLSPSTPAEIIGTSHQTTSTSCHSKRFKGVRRRSWGRWVSEIRLPRSRDRVWLGSFASAEQAACAFEAASIALRGGGASTCHGHYKGLNLTNNIYLSRVNIGKSKSDIGVLKKAVRSIAASAVAAAFLSGEGARQSTSSSAPPYLEEYHDTNSDSELELESESESRTDPPRQNVNEGGAIWEADLITLSELQSDLDSNIIHLP